MRDVLKIGRRAGAVGLAALAATAARAEAPEIVIGAPNSLTGGLGESGRHVVNGLRIAAEDINAAGGIRALGGAKLRVIGADTSSDSPSQAASVTRRLITENHAVVLVGSHASTMTLSSQIEAERAGVPIITTSYADQIVQRGYMFTFKIPAQSTAFGRANMEYLLKVYADAGRPLRRIAVFHGSDAGNAANGKANIEEAKKAGLEVVASGGVPSGMTDPTPVLGPVLATRPDLVMANLFTPDMVLVIHAMRAVKLTIPVMTSGSGVSVKSIPEGLGADADGFMGTLAWTGDLPVAGVAAFVTKFIKAYPDQPFAPQEAGEGYAIGQLIGLALEKAASGDPHRIRDALATISAPTIMPGGPIMFDETGLNRNAIPIMVQWQGGTLRTIWPKDYQTAKPILG